MNRTVFHKNFCLVGVDYMHPDLYDNYVSIVYQINVKVRSKKKLEIRLKY